MPHPVHIVRIESQEGGYPRLVSYVGYSELWVVKLLAAQGSAPSAPLRPSLQGAGFAARWGELVEATEAALRADPYQGTAVASAALLDLCARRGRARGNIAVYAFSGARVEIRYDASVGSAFDEDAQRLLDPGHASIARVSITPRGTETTGGPEIVEDFGFDAGESVLLSSEPLHWSPWWPPPSIDQAVAAVVASRPTRDLLLALWNPQ